MYICILYTQSILFVSWNHAGSICEHTCIHATALERDKIKIGPFIWQSTVRQHSLALFLVQTIPPTIDLFFQTNRTSVKIIRKYYVSRFYVEMDALSIFFSYFLFKWNGGWLLLRGLKLHRTHIHALLYIYNTCILKMRFAGAFLILFCTVTIGIEHVLLVGICTYEKTHFMYCRSTVDAKIVFSVLHICFC